MAMTLVIFLTPLQKFHSLKQPEIGYLIRELRQLLGLTQEQFGLQVGVSYETINRWENGKMQPSPLALRQLARLTQELRDTHRDLEEQSSSEIY